MLSAVVPFELHADLFSRHVSPLEVHVFVAVDERGEDVMSDEICRRCNEKQEIRRRGQRERRTKAREIIDMSINV